MNSIFTMILLFSSVAFSQLPIKEFEPRQIHFTYLATDGTFWKSCKHVRGTQPHSWAVKCDESIFNLHLFMTQNPRPTDTVIEFHYWVDEQSGLFENRTQSTWLTIDGPAKTKSIVSYLGFQKDSTQLRFEYTAEPRFRVEN